MSVPTSFKAVVINDNKATIQQIPTPPLRDGYMFVRPTAYAINPTDWKHVYGHAGPIPANHRSGCDYAGVVVQVSPSAAQYFKPGDRVAGCAHGGNASNKNDGAFGEIAEVKAKVQIHIPDNVSDTDAAMLGVAIASVGQGMYLNLGLPWPTPESTIKPATPDAPSILIYGGSGAMGLMGVQFAKLSGYRVLATASPRNFDLLKSLGVDDVFDYKSPTVGADIRAATDGKLKLVWDTITTPESQQIASDALSPEGGKYTALGMPGKFREGVTPGFTLGYTAIGEAFSKFGMEWPARPEETDKISEFGKLTTELLKGGKLKLVGAIVNRGGKGLEGVIHGMDDLKAGNVSGGKLVYTV